MKFIVSSTTLLKRLQLINGVINPSNTLPILDNFLFQIIDGKLHISASDLETAMTSKLEVDADMDGSVAIPARLLIDTLKTFPEQPLTFVVNDDRTHLDLSSEQGNYTISCVEGSDFPQMATLEDASTVNMPADVLLLAIAKTIFATGNDELRPVMNGVFFQFSESDLTFVATDAHKLVRYRRTDLKSDSTAEFIMPKKPLNLLKAALPTAESDVKILYTEKNARFEFDDVTLVCRLIDGNYPNYQAVIPQNNENKMVILRSSFLNSMRRVSIFSNKSTHQVRLKIAGNELHISAEDLDFANKANERLACNYDGEDMEIGFNSKFLIEMLQNIEAENIRLEMEAPNRAGLLIPEDGLDEGEDVLMLVMPVMLNN